MCYQRYAKSTTRLKCCCSPSCSQYAIIALRKYGSVIGIYLSVKHCIRCGPPRISVKIVFAVIFDTIIIVRQYWVQGSWPKTTAFPCLLL